MSNILLKLDSSQLREVLYRVFEKTDKNQYSYKRLRIGVIDGSTFSKHFASVFQMVSKKAPFILDMEQYDKRGKELNASKKLITRLTKRFGKNFVDIILADGLYRLDMIKFFKTKGIRTLVKTSEDT